MTDMELVIRIPEDIYKKAIEFGHLDMCGIELAEVVLNGTPLPKGHGRLIDADKLTESILCKTFGLRIIDIENAPTIIEADSTESDTEQSLNYTDQDTLIPAT